MKSVGRLGALLLLSSLATGIVEAQCVNESNVCVQGVPHFIKLNGILKNPERLGLKEVVAVRFVLYAEPTGGTPLWQEVQNLKVDDQGRYEAVLGGNTTNGIPINLFASGEPRWLSVQAVTPGSEEEPRILLASVPYALKAADAETLGGLPASAFLKANTALPEPAPSPVDAPVPLPVLPQPPHLPTDGVVSAAGATPGAIPKFALGTILINSQIADEAGAVSMENLSNVLFANRFPGGVPDALKACPASGCVIYAYSPKVNLNLGYIDPGDKSVAIYLGPYTYTVKQIMLRKGLKLIGMGASGGVNGSPTCSTAAPCNGTALQSINGNNPVFVIPQTNNQPASNVVLSGFRMYGSVGNTSEDGFLLDTSTTVNAGLWNSVLEDISLQGFGGIGIHIRGRDTDFSAASQWLLFNNVVVFRNRGGGNALRLEGAVFELRFRNCEFDGQGIGDGTNIYIGGLSAGQGGNRGFPLSITFEGLVSQAAALAVQLDGDAHITFYDSHHEQLWGGYQITNNTNIGSHGVIISNSYFAGNVGVNAGAGFELNVATTFAEGIVFEHNQLFGSPDSVVKGTNLSSVVYQDNLYNSGTSPVPPTTGVTTQLTPAATVNIQGGHTVGLNSSTTPITTIQSGLGPGEMVTFFTLNGPVTFGAGGNIDLMGASSVAVNGTITFIRSDLGGPFWKPVSQWSSSNSGSAAAINPRN
jgi:hypothetical protein